MSESSENSAPDRQKGSFEPLQRRLRVFVARRVQRVEDVEDIVQEVMLRMHRGLPELRNEELFGSWLYRVARNAIADFGRSRARHPLRSFDGDHKGISISGQLVQPMESEAAMETRVAGQHLALALTAFVDTLPEIYRETLRLTELQGLSQQAAAEELGVSLTAVKGRVRRGRALLRVALEACCTVSLDARGGVVDCRLRDDAVIPALCCQNSVVRGRSPDWL